MVPLSTAQILYQHFLHLQVKTKKKIQLQWVIQVWTYFSYREVVGSKMSEQIPLLKFPSLSQDGCCSSIRYAFKAAERVSGKGCAGICVLISGKKKIFMKDLSQKTSAYSPWTLATPICMEVRRASVGFSGLYSGRQKEGRGWEWLFSIQSAVFATSA